MVSGDGSAPICELELELKRGDKSQLFEIARLLIHAIPTQVSLKSKAERGYEFIDGSKDLSVKANPVQLPIHGNVRDSFRAIGFACLKQILDNMPALARADPEGVHQMRVGVRRFRAAISLFKDLLHDDQTAPVKSELKWLAGELTTRPRTCGPHQARYSFAKETASQTSQWHPFIFEGARK